MKRKDAKREDQGVCINLMLIILIRMNNDFYVIIDFVL